MATQKSGKERQTWQTTSPSSSSSSSSNVSGNSLNKSANGPIIHQSNRSKAPATAKRSVTPNSRAHDSKRSVTPVPRSHNNAGDVDFIKAPNTKRPVTPLNRSNSIVAHDPEPGRVRVAVRLRPRNDEDLASDADFADCVELLPELKKLSLKKNNWSSESYKFDEVFTESASQKRIYEVVAKPVVESVLSGYNGTIMAYGQTGTGKTYTVGNLGKNDASERGIIVRAVEDLIANTSLSNESVEFSYVQLYMETIQDLLAPEKVNIPVVEDAKTGEVLLPGASVIKIHHLDHFMELLQCGEANRHAANTKLNTSSSRSHAILMVSVKRPIVGKGKNVTCEKVAATEAQSDMGVDKIRKGKLLIVDLAGSERIDKSGSEGLLLEEAKFINLSLTALGKCINALAESSPHIPTRDSKLTRILRDSFGGSARTSLIITIGPSARHHAETTSTIMFGQRAMKVVNVMKVKEEFDYERLSRKLESQVDHLTEEIDRQQKMRDKYKNEMEKKIKEFQRSSAEEEKRLIARSEILEKENARLEQDMKAMLDELNHQKEYNKLLHDEVARLEMGIEQYKQNHQENSTYQKALADTTQMYENQIAALIEQLKDEQARYERAGNQSDVLKALLSDHEGSMKLFQTENSKLKKELLDAKETHEKAIAELRKKLDDMYFRCEHAEKQVDSLRNVSSDQTTEQKLLLETIQLYEEKISNLEKRFEDEHACREHAEEQMESLKKHLCEEKSNQDQVKSKINDLTERLEEKDQSYRDAVDKMQCLQLENANLLSDKEKFKDELDTLKEKFLVEEKQRMTLEAELVKLKKCLSANSEGIEDKKSYAKQHMKESSSFRSAMGLNRSISGQRATIAKICEEVGLERILKLLSSEDIEVQMHALKVVANLAAEDINQEKIVNEGGLDALLMLLQTSQNTTILRVASGAVANLAMNETNQGLIMSKGGARLLADTTTKTDDPQTLRMVAGAIANLCGNVALHSALKDNGGIKALLSMAGSTNIDVVAQVARGLANFAKCETREVIQGYRTSRSLLMEDGALTWLIVNSKTASESTIRHMELALCHLAQNEGNTQDFIATGGLKEVIRISSESAREDIRNLAKKTLKLNRMFQAQMSAD
ncbi:kinesin-like protein KIN-UC isoform X1 [Chenopodium quinoa]|uniref:kinesin-like protein KIN-UC isoform X1 n=1 Tax=Chenopodium quinoa TaxID=63459 RepID=UPI000B778569|nr:kinesin-like protein KIN-UC isoform X1 [Chenopodium quinoa]